MLYEIYMNGRHTFNICIEESKLVDMLKHIAFMNATVRIHNTFYNTWYIWSQAQTLLTTDAKHALQDAFQYA